MPGKVLITGGTGLVGTRLTELLLQRGYSVAYLSRNSGKKDENKSVKVRVYDWDVKHGQLDEKALLEADYLINLAGAGIADARWTKNRKQEIIESRTQSIHLIAAKLKKVPHHVRTFISASAIGIYGADTGQRVITESTSPGADFLAQVVKQWEHATEEISQLGVRTVKMRIGIVLSEKGGALAKIIQPVKLGVGAALGSGQQLVSWIHLDDLANLFVYMLEHEATQGAYNAVATHPVTNEQLTKLSAEVLHKPLWLPNVPTFALRLAFGEMADVVLGGNHVLNQRIAQETDFNYQFTDAKKALEDLLGK